MATNSVDSCEANVVQINEVAYFKVVQKVDNSIHWINNFPMEKGILSFLNTLHEKFDLHQIYSVQIWCKKVQTKVK